MLKKPLFNVNYREYNVFQGYSARVKPVYAIYNTTHAIWGY